MRQEEIRAQQNSNWWQVIIHRQPKLVIGLHAAWCVVVFSVAGTLPLSWAALQNNYLLRSYSKSDGGSSEEQTGLCVTNATRYTATCNYRAPIGQPLQQEEEARNDRQILSTRERKIAGQANG